MSGERARRIEGALKVTGRAEYAGEVRPDGMLHAALVQAEITCGDVVGIDDSAARHTPGFVDQVSYDDARSLAPSTATALIREPVVHFPGQPVGLTAADTLLAARTAAARVRVDYVERPSVAAIDQALDEAYAPAMAGRIIGASHRGDPAVALAGAHLVVRNRYQTAVNNHHPMEPHVVVCWWEGEQVVVHTSTQAVYGTRAIIAHALAMPADDVRVVCRYLGGGFGCKGQLWWPWMLWTLTASKRTGRPIRLELTRAQMFTLVGRRQETVQDLAVGFDATGRLVAIEHDVLAQTSTHGEYCDTTAEVSRRLYACPNVRTLHRLVRTNEPQPIPMRAPGTAPGTFALESALDEAAEQLGIDPVELRVRNFADHDHDADVPWSSNSLLQCYQVAADRFGWAQRPASATVVDGRWRIGWGMATTCYPAHRQPCRVRVRLQPDGTIVVQCGTQDMGSGTYTVLAQMVADALGVPLSQVTVELGDTLLPEGPFSGGSQVTASMFPAARQATDALRAQLAELGMGHDETLADAVQRIAPDGIEAEGAATANADIDVRCMSFGAIFTEVGVDADLAEIRVRRVTAAFATGRVLNPLLTESQHIGGLIGGIGMTLLEQTVTDRSSGRIIGDNLADYLVPVHADMPEFDIALIDEDDTYLPGGVKGVGMLGTAGIQAAIANAIHHATGTRVRHLPIRIEDLLHELPATTPGALPSMSE